jgi:hypothetical protein
MEAEEKNFKEQLFDLGEGIVRQRVEHRSYNLRRKEWAEEWLKEQQDTREQQLRRDAEIINEKPLRLAQYALLVAIVGVAVAALAAVFAYLAIPPG